MKLPRVGWWYLLPQAISRLVSFYVFAAVSHVVGADELGALALATAFASASFALAPAIVGKPLAVTTESGARAEFARQSEAAAVYASFGAALAFVPAALLTSGLIRVSLVSGVIGIPTVMIVESAYWRSVFLDGPRRAGIAYSAAYAAQAVLVTVAASWLSGNALVVASFAALAPSALVLLAIGPPLRWRAGWLWVAEHRDRWVPYVIGVAASVLLVQAIPVVLSATAGFASASTYRAGELAFGGTNLLLGVSLQALLTRATDRPWYAYRLVSVTLVGVAAANGVVVGLLPRSLLNALIGPTAPLLLGVLAIMTIQRAAMAVSSVGGILLIPRVSVRWAGAFDVVSAGLSMSLLVAGGVIDGLEGSLVGLAAGEVVLAAVAAVMLRRVTGAAR